MADDVDPDRQYVKDPVERDPSSIVEPVTQEVGLIHEVRYGFDQNAGPALQIVVAWGPEASWGATLLLTGEEAEKAVTQAALPNISDMGGRPVFLLTTSDGDGKPLTVKFDGWWAPWVGLRWSQETPGQRKLVKVDRDV